MPSNLTFPAGSLLAFLFVLVRISGAFVFMPIPGAQGIANPARIVLCLGVATAVFPQAGPVDSTNMDIFRLAGIICGEAVFGIGSGLLVSIASESFQFGAQMVSQQSGLRFAKTIDPNSEAESTVMVTIAQLLAGCLFFAFGLDHRLLMALVHSISSYPPGAFFMDIGAAEKIVGFLSSIFATGLMTMIPVLAFLLLLDIVLAMLGRIHSQLQLMTLAFPLKLLSVTALLAWMTVLFPKIYEHVAVNDPNGILSAIHRR